MDRPPSSPSDQSNAVLPASILLGALILSIFVPWMLLFAFVALLWLFAVALRRRATIQTLHQSLADAHREHTKLTDRADRLGSIIDATDIPIIATTPQGTITHSNPAAQQVFGSGRALIATAFDELITHRAVHELAALARSNESGHARFVVPFEGQQREFDVAADPLPDNQGCVFTFRDITELTRAVALKADFAANASHELRTPIASIRGAVDTLLSDNTPDEAFRQRLSEMISSNATRLELLVNDLLDLSKLESADAPPSIEQVDLPELIDRIREQFSAICARRSITIKPTIDKHASTFSTDPSLLALILRNLIENATKFANEGSTVAIRAYTTNSPPGVCIEVADKGAGIPLADQQRIFERFYQVDEARSGSSIKRGTGLGLAIVKHACRRLAGDISVHSVYGQGTTMRVTLPQHTNK